MANERPEQTESLFNVTPARRRTYLTAFILFSLVGYGVVIWHHVTDGGAPLVNGGGNAGAATTTMSIMLGFAIAHAAALGLALTTAEITGGTMVIADWLRTKLVAPLKDSLREEGRVEGRVEGREEGRVEGREEGRVEGREEGRVEGREEGRVEGREEGRVEGREESNSNWRAWNNRRGEAAERGEPFNEPEPYGDGD